MGVGMLPCHYRPYELLQKEILTEGSEHPVIRLKFKLPDDVHLGVSSPTTHMKVRGPDSSMRGRTYSLTSRKQQKGNFEICVKIYPHGWVSGYLSELEVGEVAYITQTRTKNLKPRRKVGLIAFGIGITECILTIDQCLDRQKSEFEESEVVLLYANRTMKDVVFRKEIDELQSKRAGFQAFYIYSREQVENCLKGRINSEIIHKYFGEWSAEESAFLVVGSRNMIRYGWKLLNESGFKHRLVS